ncbi:MAG: hypothetical protein AABP62_02265 [Planctomycetota bacterium]
MTSSLILLVAILSQAADAPKLDEKQLVQLLEPYYQEQAAKYEFFLDEAMTQKAEYLTKPVMRWTGEGSNGAVWVWIRQGRAEVVGCLGAYVDQNGKLNGFHEFHSLTLKPLQKVEIGTVRTWESRKPGVEPKLLTKVAAPAATDKLRLIQMRNLAREYTVLMRSGEQTHTLRLAPTPLFRFQSTNPEVLDGALFSFLWDNGTDPEFLLLLEARQTAEGQRWHYAPVRFTNREIWLTHDNKELWRAPAHNEFWTRQILRDNYASCAMGVLDLDAIQSQRETKKE